VFVIYIFEESKGMVSGEIRQRPLEKGSGPLYNSAFWNCPLKKKEAPIPFFSRRPQWRKKFILSFEL
jgi:hypothetical protein